MHGAHQSEERRQKIALGSRQPWPAPSARKCPGDEVVGAVGSAHEDAGVPAEPRQDGFEIGGDNAVGLVHDFRDGASAAWRYIPRTRRKVQTTNGSTSFESKGISSRCEGLARQDRLNPCPRPTGWVNILRRRGIDRQTADEAALVSGVARGDVAAFDALFRRYAPRLSRFLGRTTRGTHLIDEIVNDTMLVVWHKAGTYNRCSRVSTWILGIATRRRLKALRPVEEGAGHVDVDEMASPGDSGPEAQFMRKDLRRQLSDALDALSEEQRQVVMLAHFEGRSYPEIAAILGCPVNTVKTRMFHARRRLKLLLSGLRRVA